MNNQFLIELVESTGQSNFLNYVLENFMLRKTKRKIISIPTNRTHRDVRAPTTTATSAPIRYYSED